MASTMSLTTVLNSSVVTVDALVSTGMGLLLVKSEGK